MFNRYRQNVPAEQRSIIEGHDAPRPNWFIGSAEHSRLPRDPDLDAEVARIVDQMRNLSGSAVATSGAVASDQPAASEQPAPQP